MLSEFDSLQPSLQQNKKPTLWVDFCFAMVEMAVAAHEAQPLPAWHETCLCSVFASARQSPGQGFSESLSLATRVQLSAFFLRYDKTRLKGGLIVSGGDGESRTRVLKHFHKNFSERS